MVFRYIDVKQFTVDAKVAGILCVGGPIAYEHNSAVTLTDDWLFEHVCPNIRRRFPNDSRLCRVLGRAILFAAMDVELGERMLSQGMRDRITQAYIPTHPNVAQPIDRVPLTIYRIQDTLMIDKIRAEPRADNNDGARAAQPVQATPNNQNWQTVLVNLQRIQQEEAQRHQQTMNSIASLQRWCRDQFRTVNNNIRAFGGTIQGAVARQDPHNQARRRQATDPQRQVQEGALPATLAHTPRTLAELWEEYQFGIGGRKPAKDFTSGERGNTQHGIKQKYYRRKFVWYTMEELIRRGDTRNSAINKIRGAYGWRCSVTQIINFLIHDFKDGGTGHANLVNISNRLRRSRRAEV